VNSYPSRHRHNLGNKKYPPKHETHEHHASGIKVKRGNGLGQKWYVRQTATDPKQVGKRKRTGGEKDMGFGQSNAGPEKTLAGRKNEDGRENTGKPHQRVEKIDREKKQQKGEERGTSQLVERITRDS